MGAVSHAACDLDSVVVGCRQQWCVSAHDHLAVATNIGAPYRANTGHELLHRLWELGHERFRKVVKP